MNRTTIVKNLKSGTEGFVQKIVYKTDGTKLYEVFAIGNMNSKAFWLASNCTEVK